MKILILQNKGVSKSQITYVKKNITEVHEKLCTSGYSEKIEFDFFEQKTEIKVIHKFYSENSKGQKAYGSANVKEYLRTIIPAMTYDCVIFVYSNTFFPKDGYVAPFTTFSPLYNETQYVELPSKINKNSPAHEVLGHVIGNLLEKQGYISSSADQMDVTIVDGKSVPYHKNSFPGVEGGNYAITSLAYKPYMKYISGLREKKPTLIEKVISFVTPTKKPILFKPKNFDLKELVSKFIFEKFGERAWQFFDHRILENLQAIREHYGVPITVNDWHKGGTFQYRGFDEGGFRKEGTSQHNHGRAIDYIITGISAEQHRKDLKGGKIKLPYPNVYVEDEVTWNHMDVRQSENIGVYLFKV